MPFRKRAIIGTRIAYAEVPSPAIAAGPRRRATVAFSGPDKKTLFVPQMGAVGPDGKAWPTPDDVRNTPMTIYKSSM